MRACALAVFLVWPAMAGGQLAKPATVQSALRPTPLAFAVNPPATTARTATGHRLLADDGDGLPRWLKWGLVGAVAGGVLFATAGQTSPDKPPHSVAGDFAYGAGTGFVIVGGGVWFYDWVCSSGSRSRAAGLCGR